MFTNPKTKDFVLSIVYNQLKFTTLPKMHGLTFVLSKKVVFLKLKIETLPKFIQFVLDWYCAVYLLNRY
jgi:hypothetical protein